jgi:hypothetical protein
MTDVDGRLITGGFDERGAYGPTIVLQLASLAGVAWLRQLFLDVAEGMRRPELSEQAEVQLINIHGLRLGIATPDTERELAKVGDGAAFVWDCSSERWRTHSALLDPFLEGRSGHQYLTSEGVDDALLEVSFGESHPGL